MFVFFVSSSDGEDVSLDTGAVVELGQALLHRRHDVGLEVVMCSDPSVPQPVFTITEKAPTRAFSWLKAPTSAFTFKTLC